MSFTQMEVQCYKCGTKGHLSNTCTKNVTKGQWYMDKMKMQDAQLRLLMIGAQSWVLLPQPMAQIGKAETVKGQNDHLGRACWSTRVELFTPTDVHRLTRTCTIGSSLIHVHQSISFVINPLCIMCSKSILHYP